MCKSSLHRECLHCGTDISDHHWRSKFCSDSCRSTHNGRQRSSEYNANAAFKTKYGITLEERNNMYAAQDGCCAICGTHMTLDSRKSSSACVDHCHTTGSVGALLCSECNTGIGKLGENPVILAKAIQYLTETGKVPTR